MYRQLIPVYRQLNQVYRQCFLGCIGSSLRGRLSVPGCIGSSFWCIGSVYWGVNREVFAVYTQVIGVYRQVVVWLKWQLQHLNYHFYFCFYFIFILFPFSCRQRAAWLRQWFILLVSWAYTWSAKYCIWIHKRSALDVFHLLLFFFFVMFQSLSAFASGEVSIHLHYLLSIFLLFFHWFVAFLWRVACRVACVSVFVYIFICVWFPCLFVHLIICFLLYFFCCSCLYSQSDAALWGV